MSNSNFDKNLVDKFGTHWLQYAVLFNRNCYLFWLGLFNDASFHNFAVKFKLWYCNGYKPLSYCL